MCLNILEPKPLSQSSLIDLCVGWGRHSKSRQFSSLPWLLHFSGLFCVSLNISVVSQSARDMQRAYLSFLFCNCQSLPIKFLADTPLTTAAGLNVFYVRLLLSLLLRLKMLSSMDFSLSISNQVCHYLQPCWFLIPVQAWWCDASSPRQEGCMQALVLTQSSSSSLEINIFQFVVCIWLISTALKWLIIFDNFIQFYSCILQEKICLPLHAVSWKSHFCAFLSF